MIALSVSMRIVVFHALILFLFLCIGAPLAWAQSEAGGPRITSATVTDPDSWYATTTAVFSWDLPESVEKVAVDVSDASDTEPLTVYDPPIAEITLTESDLAEGVQYLHVQFKEDGVWGTITHQQIKIDTTPPEPFIVEVRPAADGSFPHLLFETEDALSGVAGYTVTVAGKDPVRVETKGGQKTYTPDKLTDGTYTTVVTAADQAGNIRKSVTSLPITAGWASSERHNAENIYTQRLFSLADGVIVMQFLFIVGLLFYLGREKQLTEEREEELRTETLEIQEQTEKIFSALRDEIYEQINLITKKPRLSKKEKEAVESLTNTLKISEKMIEKEVTDVKDLLK